MDFDPLLQELKSKGLEVAIIRNDGLLVSSTINMDDVTPNVISSLSNISDAMFKQIQDNQKEIEVTFDGLYFVILPIKNLLLCGLVKQREQKKDLRDASEKIASMI